MELKPASVQTSSLSLDSLVCVMSPCTETDSTQTPTQPMVIYHHVCDASNSFSAVAECFVVVNTHQESVCSSIFGLRARDSWDYALLLLCCLGAGSSYLQKHKRRIHSNSILYECPYCGKLFKIHGQLKHHVHIHTGAKPYSCRHCSDCFTRLDQLKTHLLKSHNEGT